MDDISRNVHDGLTLEEISEKITDLRKEIGKFEGVDLPLSIFKDLKTALLALNRQMAALKSPAADFPEDGTFEISLFDPSTERFVISFTGCEYEGILHFEETITPIVESRSDRDLSEAFAAFQSALNKASTKKVVDEDLISALNYFCLFGPGSREFAEERPAILRSFLQWLTQMIKKAQNVLTVQSAEVWKILQNPDDYYLLLRGKIEQLRKQNEPEMDWLRVLTFLPDLFRLYVRLLFDGKVSAEVKLFLLGSIAYLILPVDFIPESIIGPAGYAEDVFVLAKGVLDLTNDAIVPMERLEMHWSGTAAELHGLVSFSRWFSDNLDFFKAIDDWRSTQWG